MKRMQEIKRLYLESVGKQIQGAQLRRSTLKELSAHIDDAAEALVAQGLDEDEALCRAIAQTGDSVPLGRAIRKAHREPPKWYAVLAAVAIIVFCAWGEGVYMLIDSFSLVWMLLCAGLACLAAWFVRRKKGKTLARKLVNALFAVGGIAATVLMFVNLFGFHLADNRTVALLLIHVRICLLPLLYGLAAYILLQATTVRKTTTSS